MKTGDVFERVASLFCRVIQRDTTERPGFVVEPLQGADWGAAVYLGKVPKPFQEHYDRQRRVKAALEGCGQADLYCSAVGQSASAALEALEGSLREELRRRILGDLSAWETATGAQWPGVAPVERVEARPNEPDPSEAEWKTPRRRALPPARG